MKHKRKFGVAIFSIEVTIYSTEQSLLRMADRSYKRSNYEYLSEEEVNDAKSDGIPDLDDLECLNEMMKKRFKRTDEKYTLEKNRDNFTEGESDIRAVVIGKTGEGKSATANTILGKTDMFTESRSTKSETATSREEVIGQGSRTVSVIDTPGLFDTSRSNEDILKEVATVINKFREGIHVFIYVKNISSPRFTPEEKETFDLLQSLFGGDMIPFLMIVFTNAEAGLAKTNLDDYYGVQRDVGEPVLASILTKIDSRVVAVNNATTVPREKRRNQQRIISIMDKMTEREENLYTTEMFEKAKEAREALHQKARNKGWDENVLEAATNVIDENPDLAEDKPRLLETVWEIISSIYDQDNLNYANFAAQVVEISDDFLKAFDTLKGVLKGVWVAFKGWF